MWSGELNVVKKYMCELNFAENPPKAHDKGIARPEGPGCVPGGVGRLDVGDPPERKGGGLFGWADAPEGGAHGVPCHKVELRRPGGIP